MGGAPRSAVECGRWGAARPRNASVPRRGRAGLWGVEARPPSAGAARRSVDGVDNRSDIRDFLASRRARITPEQAGLLPGGGRRRVPGLRREEVAVLAGVSTDWYTRLEKGHIAGVSEDVLEAVARALQLDEAERTYLFDLARAARAGPHAPAPQQGADPAARPVDAGLDDGVGSVRRQRPAGHRGDQHAGAGAALTAVRRPAAAGELRPVPVPRPAGARLLPGLGGRGQHHRRPAPRRGRPPPARRAAARARR